MGIYQDARVFIEGVRGYRLEGMATEHGREYNSRNRQIGSYRENAILERCEHPSTISDFLDLFAECTEKQRYKKAHKLVNKLVKRGLLRIAGLIPQRGQRSLIAYCKHIVKGNQLSHEMGISRLYYVFARHTKGMQYARTNVNPQFRADMELLIGNVHIYCEYDTGTERHEQVKERWGVLSAIDESARVLWVTETVTRKENLSRLENPLQGRMVIACFDELLVQLGAVFDRLGIGGEVRHDMGYVM